MKTTFRLQVWTRAIAFFAFFLGPDGQHSHDHNSEKAYKRAEDSYDHPMGFNEHYAFYSDLFSNASCISSGCWAVPQCRRTS